MPILIQDRIEVSGGSEICAQSFSTGSSVNDDWGFCQLSVEALHIFYI